MKKCQLACPLWWIFPITMRAKLASRAKAKRSVFRVFQKNDCPCQGGCHESGFRLCHYSQVTEKGPPMCGTGDCRDGDKLLCNICPLKHEARERERGEMLYENVPN